jgi:hypothetical protein
MNCSHLDEICALLGYYAALSGSSWASWPLKMGPISFPETSVQNCHSTLRHIPEERRSHLHGGGSLKSRMFSPAVRVPITLWFSVTAIAVRACMLSDGNENRQAYRSFHYSLFPKVVFEILHNLGHRCFRLCLCTECNRRNILPKYRRFLLKHPV